jgi:toxin FitB
MWLLDTVAVSEPTKPNPSTPVTEWLAARRNESLYTSVLCIGEIRRGVERLAPGAKRTRLRSWLEADLPAWFGPRVLGIDLEVAQLWGELTANAERTVPVVDGLIAATALRHQLTIVTRNTRDFEALEVPVLDPWAT